MKFKLLLTAAGAALALSACGGEPAETSAQTRDTAAADGAADTSMDDAGADEMAGDMAADEDWSGTVEAFLDDYFKANPEFAVYQGRHDYDGQLPDWTSAGLNKEIARLKAWRGRIIAIDADGLSDENAFERRYLIARIDGDLFWRETADWPHKNPAFYAGSLDPDVYISRPYADKATRMKAFIAYAKNVPTAAAQIRANLPSTLPRAYIEFGYNAFSGYADYFSENIMEAFDGVGDDAAQTELEEAAGAASDAMRTLADQINEGRETAGDDFALGAAKFSAMLKATEMVDTPLSELESIGRADLERNQAALKSACAEYAPDADIKACVAKVAESKPEGGAVAGARKQLPKLKQFLIDHNIVSIPGTEEAQVEESPPYNRQNSAYISIPGPYEKGLPSVYYISPPDPTWSPEVQRAYIPGKEDLLFTSVHEVWPGHFLNFLHANRAGSILGRVYIGYAFAEGWAHYCEEMMWEAGLHDGDPETHIGQLLNALLRDVRFLSAIGLHTQGMTVAESQEMFLNDAYTDEGNARQQALRGTYDPAYLNYTLGKLMIRKLRADWTASRGGEEAWHDFHDAFLSYGGPPIPMVRGAMMDEEPSAKF